MRAGEKATIRLHMKSPMLAPGDYHLIVYAHQYNKPLCWVERVEACRISGRSYFSGVKVLDEIKGVIVPEFTIDVRPLSEQVYASADSAHPTV
jgi:hypothetical protein